MWRAVAPSESHSRQARLNEKLVHVLGCPCSFVAEEQMVALQGIGLGLGLGLELGLGLGSRWRWSEGEGEGWDEGKCE